MRSESEHPIETGLVILFFSMVFLASSIVGFILGIIAKSRATKAKAIFEENPGKHRKEQLNKIDAAWICGTIGYVLNIFLIPFLIWYGTRSG